ncbi:hypothetical protein Ptr902_01376 [Pyrenophora tritici-repentis]|nr:hypothetical protein Ptr902_01376 [Pyrenophora tritici-repentis]
MVHTACPSVLALRLPDPRFSVDFNSYQIDASAYAISRKYMQDLFPGQNKPLPPPKTGTVYNRTLRSKPSCELPRKCSPLAVFTAPSTVRKYDQASVECPIMLDESHSSASDWSSASPNSTMVSSMTSNTTAITSNSSSSDFPLKRARTIRRSRISLLDLPQTTVEQILAYVLTQERSISITPHQPQTSPKTLRRQQYRTKTVDIRSIMQHPVLLVSHQMRALGLNTLYQKGHFLIDLCNMSNGTDADGKEAENIWDFWKDSTTPRVVQEALSRALNVRFQVPVPSMEATVGRGEKKRKTEHQDDPPTVHEILQAITALITGVSKNIPKEQPRSASPTGPQPLRRKLSFRSAKRPDSLEFACRGHSPVHQPREPLHKLEVVLVKSSTEAEVPSQTLELVATCSSIPVAKSLEYYLQLEERRRLWAKRDMGKWQGCEPDGTKLLHDLRSLGRIPVRPRPEHRPDTSKKVAARPTARTDRTQKEKVWYKQHLTGGKLHKDQKLQPFTHGIMVKKTKEVENQSKFKILKGTRQPPTVQELQQIAADIRRGIY